MKVSQIYDSDKGTLNVISNHIQTVLGRFSLRGYHLF